MSILNYQIYHVRMNCFFGSIPSYTMTDMTPLATLKQFAPDFPKMLIDWKIKKFLWTSKLDKVR